MKIFSDLSKRFTKYMLFGLGCYYIICKYLLIITFLYVVKILISIIKSEILCFTMIYGFKIEGYL